MRQISLLCAALAIGSFSISAQAGYVSNCAYEAGKCRQYVGKRLWIAIPSGNPNVVEVTFTKGDWTTARTYKMKSGSFLVTGAEPNTLYGMDFSVRLDDGRSGWVGSSDPFLLDFDPIARAQALTAERNKLLAAGAIECERRGQPKIGMTSAELTESCWRQPRRIVKKTTTSGVEESYVYGAGHVVTLRDGKVVEIIEAR